MKKSNNTSDCPKLVKIPNDEDTLERTADLAKRLFRVPKEELQAEEAKYKAEQASKETKRGPKPKEHNNGKPRN